MVASDLNTTWKSGVLSARRQRQAPACLYASTLLATCWAPELGPVWIKICCHWKTQWSSATWCKKRIWHSSLSFVFILNSVVPGNKRPWRRRMVGTGVQLGDGAWGWGGGTPRADLFGTRVVEGKGPVRFGVGRMTDVSHVVLMCWRVQVTGWMSPINVGQSCDLKTRTDSGHPPGVTHLARVQGHEVWSIWGNERDKIDWE